ncbi:hypothetical protein CBR_g35005 [Chara braunii]|uniref:DUF4283 domain-containing protein n=1 Tax=Chara braunii TaxID=69332 RepID=A0A388LJZ1_CHABU|nr:hypothetical protein CBR_g35005 [Chara braunii]|eukprot:GBG82638.1 hypothetical protein CBR_g35005 [Chara braunii]
MEIDDSGDPKGVQPGGQVQPLANDVGMVGAEETTTPGQPRPQTVLEDDDCNGNRSPPQAHTNYWPEEDRIREMLAKCYDAGILRSGWDIGELREEGTKARFVLNRSLDEIKVKWLKERTVTVIFLEGSKNLPKKLKEDVIRAFEDIWMNEQRFDPAITRGRVCIESSNVLSYVAKDKRVADWMKEEGSFRVALKRRWYNIAFKPWLTKVEIQEAKKELEKTYFWIRVVDVPIDAFCYLESAAAASIGPVIKVYPPEKNASTPRLINVRMDIAIESIARLKETLEFMTFQGQVIELQVANALSSWCSKCRKYFHSEEQCTRTREEEILTEKTRMESASGQGRGKAHSEDRSQFKGGGRRMVSESSKNEATSSRGDLTPSKQRRRLSMDMKELRIQDEVHAEPSSPSIEEDIRESSKGAIDSAAKALSFLKHNRRQATGSDKEWDKYLLPLLLTATQEGMFALAWTISAHESVLPSQPIPGPPMPRDMVNITRRLYGSEIALEVLMCNIRHRPKIKDLALGNKECKAKALADDLFAVCDNSPGALEGLKNLLDEYS